MQLDTLRPKHTAQKEKRIARGGKKGTTSGKGTKGQKSRAGARIRPGFRGGDNPIWKLFPKQRGATKKVDIKHSKFQVRYHKPAVINLDVLNSNFKDGDKVEPKVLVKRGVIGNAKNGIKVLSDGELTKKLNFSGLKFSKSAREKILKSGSTIK